MKRYFLALLMVFFFSSPVYAIWHENHKVELRELTGDFTEEIIVYSSHSAGTGHSSEGVRIYKDEFPQMKLILDIRTLDRWNNGEIENEKISEVTFKDPVESDQTFEIVVHSKEREYSYSPEGIEERTLRSEQEIGMKRYQWNGKEFEEVSPRKDQNQPESLPEEELIDCPMDAKLCPDGSYVGRSGPKCEFKPCPGEK